MPVLALLSLLLAHYPASHAQGFVFPYFMLCNYDLQSGDRSDRATGDITLTMRVHGNPEYYQPERIYTMTVVSSQDFDGFQINAIFSMHPNMTSTPGSTANVAFLGGGGPTRASYGPSPGADHKRFMCSRHVHAHFGDTPLQELSFRWMAPAKGTGCISFQATATRNQQILFNSVTLLHLCEQGNKIDMSVLHDDGLVFRDDFDSSKNFDPTLWSTHTGLSLSDSCGVLSHGKAAVACEDTGNRELITTPLNLTTASVLQFSTSTGSCNVSSSGSVISVYYGTDTCTNWTLIQSAHVPKGNIPETHIIHLPIRARRQDICIKWEELADPGLSWFDGCWLLDNVVIVNLYDPPTSFQDDFDPMDPGDWLFFSGAKIQHECHSDQKAMIFESTNQTRYVTTRDLNLLNDITEESYLLREDFEVKNNLDSWLILGGGPGIACDLYDDSYHLVMDARDAARSLCTPYMDLTHAGTVSFYFVFGDAECSSGLDPSSRVFVYVEDRHGHSSSVSYLETDAHQAPRDVTLPLLPGSRMAAARVCWTQKSHQGAGADVWVVDNVRVLRILPAQPEVFVQFDLNMECGPKTDNVSVVLEYSTNHGSAWWRLYEPCTDLECYTTLDTATASFSSSYHTRWKRVSLPVPNAAMSPYTRFRWSQESQGKTAWALDNVYIGNCTSACSNQGKCTRQGCVCDPGYSGPACSSPDLPLPSALIEDFSSRAALAHSFSTVLGSHSLGYACGIVATGKALVFDGDGPRRLETRDINTETAGYLQFSVRVGSDSMVGQCPPPDDPAEVVLLHYTCDGGTSWHLLRKMAATEYTDPIMMSVPLPPQAQDVACRFRWWQPVHSGSGHDVWALDDVSVTSDMYNTIDLTFDADHDGDQPVEVHLGVVDPYCGRQNVLSFTDPYQQGEYRYLMTGSMRIGPSYVLQFDLVMGCDYLFVPHLDNKLYLEFSTNHGMTWDLVRAGCWPPRMCEEYHAATVYSPAEYQEWRRVTLVLPQHTWSSSTRLRLRQPFWSFSDSWAVDNLYIGLQCPRMCRGHGYCTQAKCSCDPGYTGLDCQPASRLPSTLNNDFSLMSELPRDWLTVLGGEMAGPNQGCGIMLSGESLFFFQSGPRLLTSRDLNTSVAQFVEFYIQLGGDHDVQCFGIESREENVLVQYSQDGGVTWGLLKELQGPDYAKPSLVHLPLPPAAQGPSVRLRWWQPSHSGAGTDQWAIDQVMVGRYQHMDHLEDDFEVRDSHSPVYHDLWQVLTDPMYTPYCGSPDDTLMFGSQQNNKIAMTKDLNLKPGDTIQFQINVGCSKSFSPDSPVLLEYSLDAGMTWALVTDPCYHDNHCHHGVMQGSVYYTGQYGEWTMVVLPVPEKLAKGQVNLRWWQRGGLMTSFALNDVYIGPTCPDMCEGHGMCVHGECVCQQGYGGTSCLPMSDQPQGMIDRFEDTNLPSSLWGTVLGGYLGLGCGVVADGNSLYFDGEGPREVKTVPLNTTHIKMLQFVLRVGSRVGRSGCESPQSRTEAVIVDYTRDNGIHWTVLRVLDPELYMDAPHAVTVPLPGDAKTGATVIRWWQPLVLGSPRAQWAIDDVIIAVNDSAPLGFQENFSPMKPEVWYMAMNAVPKITCRSRDNALEFSKNGNMRYAETWDYQVTMSTFLQFDIAMGCSGTFSTLYSVRLEYSTDMGHTWAPVLRACLPPEVDCSGYHLSSEMSSQAHANWTRVTLYLPPGAVSPATRFRWLQETVTLRGNVWALDNIYLGAGCPWMCSGHGYCQEGVCVCDPGYSGLFCVPSVPLPMSLRDDFDAGLDAGAWREVYGGEVTDVCGLLVHGDALTFYKDNLRMAVTRELDVSMATFVEFFFQYGCRTESPRDWLREHTVLLQYSTNGGIVWSLLEDLHHMSEPSNRYLSLTLPHAARTNATKFRFWQPKHKGHMQSVWSIDNVYIGGSIVNPDTLVAMLDGPPNPDDWLFWPSGDTDQYCAFNVRSDTLLSSPLAMVFRKGVGEHSITTRDLTVSDITVIQFEINVGCTDAVTADHPVRLEFSTDSGRTWQLVVPPCSAESMTCVQGARPDPTVYYSGESRYWRRVVVSLSDIQLCGTARFRWYQGYFPASVRSDHVPVWALRHVYIGMQCVGHCSGHGGCVYGMACSCNQGYSGDQCQVADGNPTYLKEDFDDNELELSPSRWSVVSGAERTSKCGTLAHGRSLHFIGHGVRAATTGDLDLSTALIVQFFLRLSCASPPPGGPPPPHQPVYVQYSLDAGISWETLQTFSVGVAMDTIYVAMEIPHRMRSTATRVRWAQAERLDGQFEGEWALDQIYIGGDSRGRMVIADDLSQMTSDHWLLTPGAVVEAACGLAQSVLHFSEGDARYAVTNDVTVTEATYMQFFLSMGCAAGDKCFAVQLEYSVDFGKSWQLVVPECTPSDAECTTPGGPSVYAADVYTDWTRVTVELPHYTRTKATRFRFFQRPPVAFSDSWALSGLYIGDECVCSCGGHGICVNQACKCDKGWSGDTCTDPVPALPTLLTDAFTAGPTEGRWGSVTGAEASTACGVLSSGPALHFTGPCTRQLVSRDLDLRQGVYVHFNFRFGCVLPPQSRDQGVVLDYSGNGGKTWARVVELYYDQYAHGSYVMIDLPIKAKQNGVRLRFWQPNHPKKSGAGDWAIDNIVIGGKDTNIPRIKDTFNEAPVKDDIWLQQDNIKLSPYCGSDNEAVQGIPIPGENVTLMTSDLAIGDDYIIQFSISVGCNESWDAVVSPVHLQYSVDYGMTWHHLVEQCLPYSPQCHGRAHTASLYYVNPGWRRVTIYLTGPVVSGQTRFRWCQPLMLLPSEAYRQHWAVDDVYIGPACTALCTGRGRCDYPDCRCDGGYGGEHCEDSKPAPTYLKDSFASPQLSRARWSLVQGGHVEEGCAVLVEGSGLHFSGQGQREAVTVDLDLRNARFVQYYALIGGSDNSRMECGTPKWRNESIIVQYSTDGGTTWHILHVLDYQSYWIVPHRDYIPLPPAARSPHTRLRWWQPLGAGRAVIGWTLDDVYIGGHAINPSHMAESFDDVGAMTTEFHPGGSVVTSGVCGKHDAVMLWPGGGSVQSLTTQQMIVQENYMLQFKLVLGCGSGPPPPGDCPPEAPRVVLEYNKDPSSEVWDVVYPRCVLNSHETSMECTPYRFQTGSVYAVEGHAEWRRVTMRLPLKVYSSETRLRWRLLSPGPPGPVLSWALDDVYVGEQCPLLCQGRGECVEGRCVCDPGYEGEVCDVGRLPLRLSDGFEGGVSPVYWASVTGGGLGMGCGPLSPWAHGKNLYFNGCGLRQAITTEIDTSKATKVMFVLQIGSGLQKRTCNVDLTKGPGNGMVVLQYTTNKGIDWHLIATHAPSEFLVPRKVGYNVPHEARGRGVQLRWWQTEHSGAGGDQWAIDDVEVITTRVPDYKSQGSHFGPQPWQNSPQYRRI